MQRVTEQSNELTTNIDIATPSEMVELLHQADSQMFSPEEGLFSARTVQAIEKIATVATRLLENGEDNLIVMSGCGTSGRIAFQTYRTLSSVLSKIGNENCVFDYLIAGSNDALFESRESVEDNPHIGRRDLDAISAGKSSVLYIGITCGLSAAYVAGQLDFCMDHVDRFVPVLIGFNPVSAARDVSIESWHKTFLQVCRRLEILQEEDKGFILNPIIGPEPITGSTRMKGGSATKILLHTIFMTSLMRHQHHAFVSITDQLRAYQQVNREVYSDVTQLARVVELAGCSLRSGGHIYYIAVNDSLALCGIIDASECKPTFGASIEDVRAFIVGGHRRLRYKVADLSSKLQISHEYFESEIVPRLTSSDFVILLAADDEVYVSDAMLNRSAVKVLINFSTSQQQQQVSPQLRDAVSLVHSVRVPSSLVTPLGGRSVAMGDAVMTSLLELSCKLTCNVVTTCGYVLYGKVYRNYMIDLSVSNNKLFYRAVSIVQKLAECGEDDATVALLKCIYQTDSITSDILSSSVSQHVHFASNSRQVVPTAILLVKLGCSRDRCRRILSHHPIVREALSRDAASLTD